MPTESRTRPPPKRLSGGAGATATKTALARRLRRERTPTEAALWSRVRRNGLGVPCRRQAVIRGWIVDFYLPTAALVIEVDGGVHLEQEASDRERDEVMTGLGLHVVRIANGEVEASLEAVVKRLREVVLERVGRPLP